MYGTFTVVLNSTRALRDFIMEPIVLPSKHKKNFHAWNQPPKGPRK